MIVKNKIKYFLFFFIFSALWAFIYVFLPQIAAWVRGEMLGLTADSSIGAAVEFFLYDSVKILMLLVAMVYVLALLRASLDVSRVKGFLSGKGRLYGYLLASVFGAITPFCSCSSVPLFIAFTQGGIPLGVTMAFLITSPLINEVAVILLFGLLGWKLTLTYIVAGLTAGVVGGMLTDMVRGERWLQPFLLQKSLFTSMTGLRPRITLERRHNFAVNETRNIFRKVWKWVFIGVGLGAAMHGWMPDGWIERVIGEGQWWTVPAAVVAGVPLYVNVTGVVPVMEALLLKGASVGTTLAFCMSAVALSLPELLMLRQVMRLPLLVWFVGVLMVLFTMLGWLFNILF